MAHESRCSFFCNKLTSVFLKCHKTQKTKVQKNASSKLHHKGPVLPGSTLFANSTTVFLWLCS